MSPQFLSWICRYALYPKYLLLFCLFMHIASSLDLSISTHWPLSVSVCTVEMTLVCWFSLAIAISFMHVCDRYCDLSLRAGCRKRSLFHVFHYLVHWTQQETFSRRCFCFQFAINGNLSTLCRQKSDDFTRKIIYYYGRCIASCDLNCSDKQLRNYFDFDFR